MTRNITDEREILGLASEICIWKNSSNCKDCNLEKKLFCKPHVKYSLYFGFFIKLEGNR